MQAWAFLWQAYAGGALHICSSGPGCFWPICSKRFTWTPPNSLLSFLSSPPAYFTQISLLSHMYKYKPPAPNSGHRWCFLGQCSGHVLVSLPQVPTSSTGHFLMREGMCQRMELTLEKTTEGRGLDNFPMTKGRDGNSISNEREVPRHFYNAQF